MSMKQVLVITSCIAAINISVCHRETRKQQRLYCERKLTGNGDSFCKELLSVNVK